MMVACAHSVLVYTSFQLVLVEGWCPYAEGGRRVVVMTHMRAGLEQIGYSINLRPGGRAVKCSSLVRVLFDLQLRWYVRIGMV